MAVQRIQILAPGTSLATPVRTAETDVSDASQIIFEFQPSGLTANLEVTLEFCCAGSPSAFGPEPIENIGAGAVVSSDFVVPVYTMKRTWSQNLPFFVASPCGYTFVRALVGSSDAAGTVAAFLNKVANRGG